jgi:hypothetical protein
MACAVLAADQEASNTPFIRADQWGRCYAKAVPSESYGAKGTTKVYMVQPGDDALLYTFDWYSNNIYLQCVVGRPNEQIGLSLVRFGPWARGRDASTEDVALAFYFRGQLVRQYSTLDIAESAANVSRSRSHYSVIKTVYGYRPQRSTFSTFEVLTADGRRLVFDPTTGAILSTSNPARQSH